MIDHCVSRHFLYIVAILTPQKEPGNGTRKIEYTLSTDGTDDSSLIANKPPPKGRTIKKSYSGMGKFLSRRNFFRYQIPCMNYFRP